MGVVLWPALQHSRAAAAIPWTQGEYQVKLIVDGEWRVAGEWPTVTLEDGSTNNVLKVE